MSLSNRIESSFLTFRNNSSIIISSSSTVLLFFLGTAFLLSSILLVDNNNDNTALAFKPTVPTDQIQQEQGQEQQPNMQISEEYRFVRAWGSYEQLSNPVDIAIDMLGNVYVAGQFAGIKKFDSNGNFINQWGSEGTGPGEFGQYAYLDSIAVDSSGNVYVADADSYDIYDIQKFDSNGNFIIQWKFEESQDDQVEYIEGIAIDSSNNMYLAIDNNNNNILKFDSNGKFITKWGSNGTDNGEFVSPSDIAVDSLGHVYIVDSELSFSYKEIDIGRIQKFDSNGNYITQWGSEGTKDGQFYDPTAIAVDSSDNVYVLEAFGNRIQKFDSNGNFITKWGNEGNGPGQFDYPQDIAVDSSTGNVYVADKNNQRIQVFAPSSSTSG